MIRTTFIFTSILCLSALSGCEYDEGLVIENITGTVVVPRAAATRELLREDGSLDVVTDASLIGPVYLGLYASVVEGQESYPHPEVGPQFEADVPGNTHPYGGTTVGDLRYACFEFLSCKIVSGRFVDFDDMIHWFNQTLQLPITDAAGNPVETGDFVRQTCYELLDVTSDEELLLTAYDRNEDGDVNELDLDFVENEAGDFVGDFIIWQQDYYPGFSLWGWMDSPSTVSYTYTTCSGTAGYNETEYNNDFFGGRPYEDVLNFPSIYISEGDWVASEGYAFETVGDTPELWLDFEVIQ